MPMELPGPITNFGQMVIGSVINDQLRLGAQGLPILNRIINLLTTTCLTMITVPHPFYTHTIAFQEMGASIAEEVSNHPYAPTIAKGIAIAGNALLKRTILDYDTYTMAQDVAQNVAVLGVGALAKDIVFHRGQGTLHYVSQVPGATKAARYCTSWVNYVTTRVMGGQERVHNQ